MAKVNMYRYTVQGAGTFPVDMLRYDRCWPSNEIYAPAITERVASRVIRVQGLNGPSRQRWASFNWAVVSDVEITKVDL